MSQLKKIAYICPVHPDQILAYDWVSDGLVMKMLVPERPHECKKCRKSYYKEECIEREVDDE